MCIVRENFFNFSRTFIVAVTASTGAGFGPPATQTVTTNIAGELRCFFRCDYGLTLGVKDLLSKMIKTYILVLLKVSESSRRFVYSWITFLPPIQFSKILFLNTILKFTMPSKSLCL